MEKLPPIFEAPPAFFDVPSGFEGFDVPPGLEGCRPAPSGGEAVSQNIREYVEWKTSSAMDSLSQHGRRALAQFARRQREQEEKFHGQLSTYIEACQKLEKENRELKDSVKALTQQLRDFIPTAVPTPMSCDRTPAYAVAAPAAPAPRGDSRRLARHRSDESAASQPSEDFQSPPVSPARETSASTSTFSITLRRADNVSLGLDVNPSGQALVVEAVKPDGAVEAWNRLSAGSSREVKRGDRIVAINDASCVASMREECRTKRLLKITLTRTCQTDA